MGKVETRKNDNGTLDLEITYGGDSVPFSGLDSSAASMYIDPGGFLYSANYMVINGQIVCCGWQDLQLTFTGLAGQNYLGAGKFFANSQYYNWILAWTRNSDGMSVDYSIWVWKGIPAPGTVIPRTGPVLTVANTNPIGIPATAATAVITVASPYTLTGSQVDQIFVNTGISGPTYYSAVYGPGASGPTTPAGLQTALIASINSAIGTVGNVSAAADTNPADPPFSIVLTTLATGLGANSTPLNISISHYGAGNPNINGVTVTRGFSGGAPPVSGTAVLPACEPLQWTAIGENLYFSGPGPCILQFSYPNEVPTLVLLTQKLGAVTLGKYNNQLIAGGVFNGTTSTPYQFPEMVVAWSAPNNYGQWDAIDGNGFVTGAGFNEISDISDYISGLFISNNVLVVLRSFGVDYMNALQNGVIPFDFNHISNALVGEGCQDSRLATQYDQIGCFVGYSDVYEWAGQLTPIGTKIKTQIINAAVAPPVHRDSIACTALLHFTLNTYAFFLIDRTLFVYCFNNKTWTHFPWQHIAGAADVTHIDHVAQYNTAPEYYEFNNVMIPFMYTNANKFYTIYDNIQTTELPNANPTSLYFRTEEIMFGRDITVDSVYVNMAGSPGQVVNFNVWSESTLVLSGSVTIPAGVSPYQFNNYQVFFTEQVNTLKNPMLQILVPLGTPGVYNKLYFAKIAMFGSFDPAQRPT